VKVSELIEQLQEHDLDHEVDLRIRDLPDTEGESELEIIGVKTSSKCRVSIEVRESVFCINKLIDPFYGLD